LKALLDQSPVVELEVDDRGVITDVDTPAEYESLRARPDPRTRST
jgi:hypothetical protein